MSANQQRARESVRNFNTAFRPGQLVQVLRDDGTALDTKTWSPAGLGPRDVPSVFVDGISEPVPIDKLRIEGYELVYGKRAKAKEAKE